MKSNISGPLLVTGNLNPQQVMDPDLGPSLFFQGGHVLDPRQVGGIESAIGIPGYKAYGMYASPYIAMIDIVPQALSATRIAAGQAVTAATPMTLASVQAAGLSIAIPVVPFGLPYVSTSKVTPAVCLDFGFTTGTSTAASANLTGVPAGAWRFFKKGQRIIVAGAGAAANLPLYTTVAATPAPGATTVVMSDVAGTSQAGAQVGSADPWGVGAAWPYVYYNQSGADVAIADPNQMCGRAVSITSNAGSTAQNVTVNGYDMWGQLQSEVIPFAGGAATTNGKKAFKWITSVVPATTDAGHLMSVGTLDIFGFNMRAEFWEYLTLYYNGALITSSTGWVTADQTDPATNVTGDTRGTYAVQSATDAVKRLTGFLRIPTYNLMTADNLGYKTLFGVTPA